MSDLVIPDIGTPDDAPVGLLCDEVVYRSLTGDDDSAASAVEENLERAQGLVEEYLRRPLVKMERTETLRVTSDGNVYPLATPIDSVSNGHTIRGGGYWLSGGASDNFLIVSSSDSQEVTYTGGYTSATVPTTICHAIVQTAYSLLHPSSEVPVGASAVSLGDASITFGAGGAGGGQGLSEATQTALRRWIRREP